MGGLRGGLDGPVRGAIIGLIAWAISRLGGSRESEPRARSALDIAKERYARGELTREQFEQIRDDLRGG